MFACSRNLASGRSLAGLRCPDGLATFVVAPLTTGGHPYPFRVPCRFARKDGHVVLDQVRTVDQQRLMRRLGALTEPTLRKILGVLQQMFAA